MVGSLCVCENYGHSFCFSGNDKRAEGISKPLDFGFGDFLLPGFVRFIQHDCPLLSFAAGARGHCRAEVAFPVSDASVCRDHGLSRCPCPARISFGQNHKCGNESPRLGFPARNARSYRGLNQRCRSFIPVRTTSSSPLCWQRPGCAIERERSGFLLGLLGTAASPSLLAWKHRRR
jgi:hypothetical protein